MGAVGCLSSRDLFGRDQVEKMFVISGGGGTLLSDEERRDRRMTCRLGGGAIYGG